MKKSTKNWLIAIAIILIAAVVYFVFMKPKGKATTSVTVDPNKGNEAGGDQSGDVGAAPEGNDTIDSLTTEVSRTAVPEPRLVR